MRRHDPLSLVPLVPCKLCLRQTKATGEHVVGHDDIAVKPATLERKDIQSMKPVRICKAKLPSYAFDYTSCQKLCALQQNDAWPGLQDWLRKSQMQ